MTIATCKTCKKKFCSNSALNRHLKEFHLDKRKYQCPYCTHKSTRITDLNQHVQRMHPERAIPNSPELVGTPPSYTQHTQASARKRKKKRVADSPVKRPSTKKPRTSRPPAATASKPPSPQVTNENLFFNVPQSMKPTVKISPTSLLGESTTDSNNNSPVKSSRSDTVIKNIPPATITGINRLSSSDGQQPDAYVHIPDTTQAAPTPSTSVGPAPALITQVLDIPTILKTSTASVQTNHSLLLVDDSLLGALSKASGYQPDTEPISSPSPEDNASFASNVSNDGTINYAELSSPHTAPDSTQMDDNVASPRDEEVTNISDNSVHSNLTRNDGVQPSQAVHSPPSSPAPSRCDRAGSPLGSPHSPLSNKPATTESAHITPPQGNRADSPLGSLHSPLLPNTARNDSDQSVIIVDTPLQSPHHSQPSIPAAEAPEYISSDDNRSEHHREEDTHYQYYPRPGYSYAYDWNGNIHSGGRGVNLQSQGNFHCTQM